VQEKRRFSTWFFVVRAPEASVKIVSLHYLTQHSTIKSVMEGLAQEEAEIFETRFKKTESGFVTFWQGDAGYDSEDMTALGPRRRLVCGRQKWEYQTEN